MSRIAPSSRWRKTRQTLSILVEAVVAAGLAPTLSNTGSPHGVCAHQCSLRRTCLTELGVSTALLADKPLLTAADVPRASSTVPLASVPVGKAIAPVGGGFFKIESTGAQDHRRATVSATSRPPTSRPATAWCIW